MENLKIRVNNEAESKEAQELFIELGAKGSVVRDKLIRYVCTYCGVLTQYNFLPSVEFNEITLPQLRDMVVLKRNDVSDATHLDSNFYKWYVASDEKHYRHQGGIWAHQPYVSLLELKPIEKGMKEYLDPKKNYELCLSHEDLTKDGMIKIPEGAEIATKGIGKVNFWKNQDREFYFNSRGEWSNNCGETLSEYLGRNPTVKTVWQRTTQNKGIEKSISNAWDIQVGGNHYKQFKIQPMQFALENKLDAAQQNVIKYIMRHSFKNGKQDLEKAKHYIDLMIEFYYGENKNG